MRTSVLVEIKGRNYVIDTGPDFRQQMLREEVKHLEAVLITHGHKDHIGGLDDVRSFNFISGKPIDVYASDPVQRAIKKEFSYAFAAYKYPGVPNIKLHCLKNHSISINGTLVSPVQVMHHKLPVLGFRIGDFTYITDASYIPPDERKKIIGTKTLVINALRKSPHLSHFNLDKALEEIEEVAPERAYLVHMSHKMGLHREVEEELPANVHLAYDGLKIEVQ